jgi:scyllo-inositol 2-dehydrogenase (NADP+)
MIDVGLIGFGLAGRFFHAPVISAIPGLRLAAILQRNRDEAARDYPHVQVVRSLDEMLAIKSIRLIVIASPNQTHFPFAKQCLEVGRNVVVDKPFTNTVAEAVELLGIAQQQERLLTVYHNRRFDADFQALRSYLATGELGRIVRFESHYDRFRPQGKQGAWREKPGPGSGILYDLAPHLIDHALMLFGRPEAISADVRIERDSGVTDDAFDLCLVYPRSMRAKLSATMLGLTPRPRFVVLGTGGSFVKREFDPLENALRSGQIPDSADWMIENQDRWGEVNTVENGQSVRKRVRSFGDWRDFYVNVRDALLGKAQLLVTPQQVLDVMVALELAKQSSAEKRVLNWLSIDWRE